MPSPLHTPLCSLLGIEQPILQSGMGGIAGPELVAEVCRAGGLGILAGLGMPPDELRKQIARVRELTSLPFGVNLWLHEAMQPPVDVRSVSESDVHGAQGALNHFREGLGIKTTTDRPSPVPDLIPSQIDVLLEERVPVFSIGLGDPGSARVAGCHERVGGRRDRCARERGRRPPLDMGEAALASGCLRRNDGAGARDRR